MSLQKSALATAIVLALAACSSSNNDTTKLKAQSTNTSASQKAAAEKAAAEKAAAEKAAAEKAAAEKAAAEKAAAEKAAAEKAAAEKAAAEKAAAEKAVAEKAAAEKAAAEKAAAEKAAAEKATAEKAAAEKVARDAKITELKEQAIAAGLNSEEAKHFADQNVNTPENQIKNKLDTFVAQLQEEKALAQAKALKGVSDSRYVLNDITAESRSSASSTINAVTQESRIQTVVYNQPYSVVIGDYAGSVSYNNSTAGLISDNRSSAIAIKGLKTEESAIPNAGKATYIGKAFNGAYLAGSYDWDNRTWEEDKIAQGALSYLVDFSKRTGSGSITGLGDTITLQQGSISGTGISANAEQGYRTGSYMLDFYGKTAEEIAGKVMFNRKDTVGFGGQRGDITK
ncbi:Slam-dependent surface lipoprotein [Neisseria brasiliensis]|uniref:Slam-dependent surface lipoprotein n=1 Tax=Neisseria brasiliensis TaxID=2666100 RepID=UPI001E3C4BB2|nr:Slam-dependent surface lipoprotein [Neisseria brasiliensis]